MKSSGLSFAIRLFSVFCLASFAACAYASNGYAISATNVTMPASGTATTKYTVSEIPIRGDLSISCAYSGPQTDANLPVCDGGPSVLIPVNAGQTVTGSVVFYPYGSVVPAVKRAQQNLPAPGLALAGALLIGLGFRRKALRWTTQSFLPCLRDCTHGLRRIDEWYNPRNLPIHCLGGDCRHRQPFGGASGYHN